MGSGSTSRSSSMSSPRTTTPSTVAERPSRCSALPRSAAKAGGMSRSRSETHASIDAFTSSRAERAAVGERDSPAKRQQEGAPALEDLPLLAQRGGEVAPPVGGEQRLEHVRHDLELLGDLECRRASRERTGLARPTTSLPPRGISSAAASPGSGASRVASSRYALAFAYSPRRLARVAARDSSRGSISAAPASRARATPFSAQRPASSLRRACQAVSAASSSAPAARAGCAGSSKSRAAAAASCERHHRCAP